MLTLCRKDVTGLSVHPTGLLALSTSRDDMLRMWNMAKGRSQYKTKIAPSTEAVSFSPDGSMYALLSGTKVGLPEASNRGRLCAILKRSGGYTSVRRAHCMSGKIGMQKSLGVAGEEGDTCRRTHMM